MSADDDENPGILLLVFAFDWNEGRKAWVASEHDFAPDRHLETPDILEEFAWMLDSNGIREKAKLPDSVHMPFWGGWRWQVTGPLNYPNTPLLFTTLPNVRMIYRGPLATSPSIELRAEVQAFIDEDGEHRFPFWSDDCFGYLIAKSTTEAEAIVFSEVLSELPQQINAREAKLDSMDDDSRPIILRRPTA